MPDPTLVEYYDVPDDEKGGDVVSIVTFGELQNVRIPDGVTAGQTLQFRLDGEGQIDVNVIRDDPIDSSASSPYFQHFPGFLGRVTLKLRDALKDDF
jgi:hypothetical protein